jgi:hypothetical protein
MNDRTEPLYRIQWKGVLSGPFNRGELDILLGRGEISLLHRIEVNGRWQSLAEFLETFRPPPAFAAGHSTSAHSTAGCSTVAHSIAAPKIRSTAPEIRRHAPHTRNDHIEANGYDANDESRDYESRDGDSNEGSNGDHELGDSNNPRNGGLSGVSNPRGSGVARRNTQSTPSTQFTLSTQSTLSTRPSAAGAGAGVGAGAGAGAGVGTGAGAGTSMVTGNMIVAGYILCGASFLLPLLATLPALALAYHLQSHGEREHSRSQFIFCALFTLIGLLFWWLLQKFAFH